jgi:hypothetical protein
MQHAELTLALISEPTHLSPGVIDLSVPCAWRDTPMRHGHWSAMDAAERCVRVEGTWTSEGLLLLLLQQPWQRERRRDGPLEATENLTRQSEHDRGAECNEQRI